jgi:hypothetical protein
MAVDSIAKSPEIQHRIAELSGQITAVQEELETIIRGPKALRVILSELHDPTSGRVDAQKVAVYMGVPLKRLAQGLQLNYKAVHRHPSAVAFQPSLRRVKRCLEILQEFFQKPETVRAWLNTPHPDLDGSTALEVILAGNPEAVLRILENAAAGVPV